MIVGSSNYTTSSRANVELGLLVQGQWEDEIFQTYANHFERLWQTSEVFGGEDKKEEGKPSRRRATGKQSQSSLAAAEK